MEANNTPNLKEIMIQFGKTQWSKGQLVNHYGQMLVIVSKSKGRSSYIYTARPATQAELDAQPVLIRLQDHATAEEAVGRVVERDGKLLLITKVERKMVNSAGLSLPVFNGIAKVISEAEAVKAKAKYEKKYAARNAEREAEHKRRMEAGF